MRAKLFFLVFGTALVLGIVSLHSAIVPLKVTVITIKECSACSTLATEKLLKNIFSPIVFDKIDYKEKKAQDFIDVLKPSSLPLFIFDPETIEKQDNFAKVNRFFTKSGSFYLLNPELSGIFYFLNRPPDFKRIDLFISLYDQRAKEIIERIKSVADKQNLTLKMHFVFDPENKVALEEYLRTISVEAL